MRRRRACATLAALMASARASAQAAAAPRDIARTIASQYVAAATPSYIPALIASGQRRCGAAAAARNTAAALRDAVGAPGFTRAKDWPSLAGYAALAEAATADGDAAAGALAVQALRAALSDTPAGPRLAGLRPWTDDMFMPVLLLDRTAPLLPDAERARAAEAVKAALLDLTQKLQRPDGLFDHAEGAPIAWGRGNGFASLALAKGLAGPLPPSPELLAALQRHLRALLPLQSADGAWRQVLDDAGAPLELTVTAMSLVSLAIARRHGWLPTAEVDAPIARAWQAVQRRAGADGRFADVCAGTPAGPTLAFYLQRPITHGRDERAAAMVLQACLALAPGAG